MELRVLRYFLAVARAENISAAAAVLHLSQPTLSRQLMELEAELGVKLFCRGKRKISLTDEGRLLRKRAEEMTQLAEKTQAELAAPAALSGEIYIGGGETGAMRQVARLVRELQRQHPKLRVHLFSGNAEEVTERLDKGLLDFGLLIQPAELAKYESLRLPQKDRWGVLMRKDSPLAEKAEIAPEDLWPLPLIGSRQRRVSGSIARWIKKDYEELNLVASYNLVYNAALLVEEGMGYALALENLAHTGQGSALCFRPLVPALWAEADIVWKKQQVFSKAAGLLLQRMQTSFAAPELP